MTSTPSGSPTMPELDLLAIARTTRKTLDRLASFSNMRSASEPLPLLAKISNNILALIKQIDSSMLAAQLGYQLATDAMIMCDPEETDWEADVSLDGLRTISRNGYQISQAVMEGFREVKQAVYKIAASTKDNMFVVLVPPDPSHPDTMKMHLKDIGTGLVANLNLLSEFSRSTTSMADWWAYVKEDLETENPSLLPSKLEMENKAGNSASFARWAAMQEGFQQYYNVINTAHRRYPGLLTTSSAAWKSVASAHSAEASSIGHGEGQTNDQTSAATPNQKEPNETRLFGMLRLKKKSTLSSKGKARGDLDEKKAQRQTSFSTSRSNSPSPSRSVQGEKMVPPTQEKTRSLFSCCSTRLFEEGAGHMAGHGSFLG